MLIYDATCSEAAGETPSEGATASESVQHRQQLQCYTGGRTTPTVPQVRTSATAGLRSSGASPWHRSSWQPGCSGGGNVASTSTSSAWVEPCVQFHGAQPWFSA